MTLFCGEGGVCGFRRGRHWHRSGSSCGLGLQDGGAPAHKGRHAGPGEVGAARGGGWRGQRQGWKMC